MKTILLTLILTLPISIYGQNINHSQLRQSGVLKNKTVDTTQQKTHPVVYKSSTDSVIPSIKEKKHSYSYSPSKNKLTKEEYLESLTNSGESKLKSSTTVKMDSLVILSMETDELGITHTKYRQFHKGVVVDGAIIIVHEKNGEVTHINGNFYSGLDIDTNPRISTQKAFEKACKFTNIQKDSISEENEVELIISPQDGIYQVSNFKLCYKVKLIDVHKAEGWVVFINAHDGSLVNKVSIIQSSSIGIATTLYSGTQSITTENKGGYYSLIDTTRSIYTYDGSNDSSFLTGDIFANPKDFIDLDNNWQAGFFLNKVSIESLSNWWYTFLSDETPDIYIKIFDGNSNLVYLSKYQSNTNPTISFQSINLLLLNPPYTLEIWDYDALSDDFGDSFTIPLSAGTHSFSNSGNSGKIEISTIGHLATDVHWGLSKTFDYYLSEFGRNSYDNAGSSIISFINPPTHNSAYGGNQNNAGAFPPPYNFMAYGLGDGNFMYPLVSLDVSAHEFTHMVTNYTADLKYEGESGAINESFSDIFGTCVEFYADSINANWLIGEDVMVAEPFMRSMSNPNSNGYPDTYLGNYWVNTSDTENDYGGVHTNSSMMNYWFYLLSEGGTGTNDNSNSYIVNGIGRKKAMKIAYRTLFVYLWENSEFLDAYYSSLQAADDLYGANSTEWKEVKRAWYAVGVINTDPDKFCDGIVELNEPSGTITDGSGSANYAPNSSCKWLIKPIGASGITINFTSFSTELDFDSVIVYSSINADMAYAQLIWSGNTLPSEISFSGGAALIEFKSDGFVESSGWSLNYTSTSSNICHGYEVLSDTTGTFTDNSGVSDYGNNQTCIWVIAPPGAQTIGLDVTYLDTEQDYDGLLVFDGEPDLDNLTNLLGAFTGTTLPSPVYAYSGEMWVLFTSDPFVTGGGFSANYVATWNPYCKGVKTLTTDIGLIEDGSGDSLYYHNSDCGWLIQPSDANSIILHFSEFDLENAEEDNKSYYDFISVYDGSDETADLLGKFAGTELPTSIESTGSSMFVKFSSDMREEFAGFTAFYQTITPVYCNANNTFTSLSGTLNDGSSTGLYGNNSDCKYLIQPPNADSIILEFTSFKTEEGYDGVIVYDGSDTTGTELAILTGDTLSSNIVAKSGAMLLWFLSDEGIRDEGWSANYTTKVLTTVETTEIVEQKGIYPNPSNGVVYFIAELKPNSKIIVTDISGKQVENLESVTDGFVNLSKLNSGTYFIEYETKMGVKKEKLILITE